jgi:murein DD-endopeptidase MepM/ murein hydrolase activator NlpD
MSRAALPLVLLAAACASAHPAPIAYRSAEPHSAPPAEAPPTPRRAPPSRPAPDWAAAEGTPLSAYALQPEDVQPYDPAHLPRTHRVVSNESLYDIATMYQLPLRALIDQNRLEPPYTLAPGRVLELPPPRMHTVERGEGFEDVARRFSIDTRSLALLNRMQPPYRVNAGDQLVLPALARELAPQAAPTLASSVTAPSAPANASAGNVRFAWPLRGDIVAGFGAQANGARLDGLEIAGREGAPIVAAADGEVVYAGSDLAAYGTLVLIRHGDNYVTAYGYGRRALVREGQRVHAGEAIAELGPRPDGRPRLLFQVRHGAEPVDPAPLLGGMSAH